MVPVAKRVPAFKSRTTPISSEAVPGAAIPKVNDPNVTATEPVLFRLKRTAVTPPFPGI
jgi:hypothetical protein